MKTDVRSLPLAGVRVLEWAEGIPGPTAGWLLAECGADVVKVERPQGDGLRESLGFHVLNRGKRGSVVDLEDAEQHERFRRLAAAADVVIVDEVESRLDHAELGYDAARSPSLVWCSLPTFPRDREWSGLPAHDALAEAAGGLSAMQWSYGKSPVHFVTPMVSYATGFVAALGIAAALRARTMTGRGQRIDTSGLGAAMLLQSGTYVRGAGHEGSLATQASDPRGVFPTYGLYQTADGWMFVGALTESFWVALATLLERTDLLADPDLPQNPLAMGRPEVRERLRRELEPIFRSQTTGEWLRRFDANDIPGGPVQSRREALEEPSAALSGVVIEVDDPDIGSMRQVGAPVLFAGTLPRVSGLAPRLDAGAAPRFAQRTRAPVGRGAVVVAVEPTTLAPLAGIRVLDLTSFIAGPLCPMLLADLGADVVKIEAASGDPFRVATFAFEGWNRGKRSLVLDLKSAVGAKAFLRLVERADVVVENFRPTVMPRLGLGYEILKKSNPRLIYTAVSGFGAEGPEAARPGFDPVMQARCGLCRAQGGDDEPVLHQVAYTDYMTGTLAAFATVAALHERGHVGRRVDVSLYRTAFAMQAAEMVECGGRMPEARGGRDLLGRFAVYRAYATRDGWIFIAASESGEASALLALFAVARDISAHGQAADGPTAQRIAAVLAQTSSAAALERLAAAGVPATRCLTFADVFESAALRRTGLIGDVDHPRLGTISQTGPFLRFSQTPCVPLRPAPALGEHGAEVLCEAGFTRAEIDGLIASGATRSAYAAG
jgi:crotonobetainyl-CoA:carnitine CoA-transferase CaiB-like acyl-CoA transferase